MLRRRSLLVLAAAAALLLLYASTLVGGSVVAAVVCAFALMIGGPIAVLVWLGSVSDSDAKRLARQRVQKRDTLDAQLWQLTLAEVHASPEWRAVTLDAPVARDESWHRRLSSDVASAWAQALHESRRFARPILGLSMVILSTIGFTGCGGVPPEAWAAVRPGMATADLVAIAGGPDYVRSNGTNEVWQYCRDFYGRDEGRYARYYTVVLVNNQTVQDIKPYPVLSSAGCQDFYRANF